jgi:hypothetical protein
MTQLVDDLDGSTADVSIGLTVDTKRYRVDLSKSNYNEYIAPLIKAARPSKVGRPARQASTSKTTRKSATRSSSQTTAYSRLGERDQTTLRSYLKRSRGRISDREVAEWKSAGKP